MYILVGRVLVGLWVDKLVEALVNERKVGGLSFQRKRTKFCGAALLVSFS
jgi:hypothetical protein